MKETLIDIVYSTDDNYVVPTFISAYSLLINSKAETFYRIHILSDGKLSDRSKALLEKLSETHIKHEILYHQCADYFQAAFETRWITKAAYYRLCIPELLPNVDKCIYIDGDTFVMADLSSLYELKLEDNYLAGVKAVFIDWDDKKKIEYAHKIGVNNLDDYINSGFLLLDCKSLRDNGVLRLFKEHQEKKYIFQDQDIINIVCFNRIYHLSPKYNSGSQLLTENREQVKRILKVYTEEQLKEANESPVVIHYYSKCKPWHSKKLPKSEPWWHMVDTVISPGVRKEFVSPYCKKQSRRFRKNAIKNAIIYRLRCLKNVLKK